MAIIETLWLIVLFVLSIHAYLSFSLISQDVIAKASQPLERAKEDYVLSPLSILFPDTERLTAILGFSRLLFVIPVLLLVYRWSAKIGDVALALSLVSVVLLLYLLPEWLLRKIPLSVFKSTVQISAYILYPIFWLLAKLAPVERVEPPSEVAKNGNPEQTTEEDSEEFKGDILKAISMIEETTVREVMTPRVDMVSVPSTAALTDLLQMFKEHKFSRLPVYKEKVDNIIGIVAVMDLVGTMPKMDPGTTVINMMRPAVFVPETKKVFTLLRELRESHAQMAIVIDEYGGTSGLVTLEDLLEEIVGEIGDEHDEAPLEYFKDKEGSIIVTGKFPIEKFEEIFGVEVSEEDFETISGLIFSLVGRIPIVGEIIKYQNLNLEIVEADKRRIHRVRIKELPKEEDAPERVKA